MALIVLIGGRITPSFTHSWLLRAGSPVLPPSFGLADKIALLASGLALLAWIGFPEAKVTALLFLAAASALSVRLWRWEGVRAWRETLLLVLHAALSCRWASCSARSPSSCRAALPAPPPSTPGPWGAVGLMTLGVMTRATRGHTGRELAASSVTMAIYGTMIAAALLRIGAGALQQAYMLLIGRPAPPGPPRFCSSYSNMRRCCLGGDRNARQAEGR